MEALWHLRADLRQAVSSALGEQTADAMLRQLDRLFDGQLPRTLGGSHLPSPPTHSNTADP